jgi:CxxC motif-containing protein
MKISEVVGDGLMWFVAVVRCVVDGHSMTTRVQIRCDGAAQARCLLAQIYGAANVLNIRQTVGEQSTQRVKPSKSVIEPVKPKSGIIKPIKPLTPKQGMKKAAADNKRAIKHR